MPGADFWLTTGRLALRRFTPGDLDWLAALYGDADVMRHLGGPQSRAAVAAMLESRILQYYDEHPGLGIWTTVERRTGAPIGLHNLNHVRGESWIQVGFILSAGAWGRGFASEMARALLRYGFVDLGLPRIVGVTARENTASQRVLEKAGLHRCGERVIAAHAAFGPQAWFERASTDWLKEHVEPA